MTVLTGRWARTISVCILAMVAGLPLGAGSAGADVGPSSIISTLAGTGHPGSAGDGGLAEHAQLNRPRDTDVGPDGSVYIADTFNQVIRRVGPDGIITTFAGTGVPGGGGDGGLATSAQLHWPHDVTVDQATGEVYIADSNNDRVRKVDADGIITTVAGNGRVGLTGDGGLATSARLNKPKGVAIGAGSLYIADGLNDAIRKVDLSSGVITRVAGTGVAGFSGDGGPATMAMLNLPQRLTVGPRGAVYVADSLNHRIRRISAAGVITTIAGTGEAGFSGDEDAAVLARINGPKGIAISPAGRFVYFADSENDRVRRIDRRTGAIATVAGTDSNAMTGDGGPAAAAGLDNPRGLTLDSQGRLLISDKGHNTIRVIGP